MTRLCIRVSNGLVWVRGTGRKKDGIKLSRRLVSLTAWPGSVQLFAGTRDHSVVAWEPPKQQLEETVSLAGHTGWVRSLATSGQWLFSASCSMVRMRAPCCRGHWLHTFCVV